MKRLASVLACIALSSCPAFADDGWGVYGSYWKPSDGEGTVGPGLKLSFETIPSVQFDIRAAYNSKILGDTDGNKLNATPLEAGLSLKSPVANLLTVYGGGGAGYYFFSGDKNAQDELGFYGVAGAEFDVRKNNAVYGSSRSSLFAEAMYRSVKPDIGGGGSIDLSGVVFNVGLMMHW